jgi:hypothetical protein
MRVKYDEDDQIQVHTTFNGDLTTTEIYDILNDICATGHSKRHPDDAYSERVAEGLANARAMQRYARKVERKLMRETR